MLEIAHTVEDGFIMLLFGTRGVIGNLMNCIENVRACGLGKVIEFANHGVVAKVTVKVMRVLVCMEDNR